MSDRSAAGLSALVCTMLGLSTISVVLRFCARRMNRAGVKADDWLAAIGFLALIPIAVSVFKAIDIGAFGTTTQNGKKISPELGSYLGVQLQYILSAFVVFSLVCTKASAVFFYRRLFCVVGPGYRVFNLITIGTIVVLLCWLIVFEFLSGFSCYGANLTFPRSDYGFKYCRLMAPFFIGMVTSDVVLDVWVLVLPIPLVFRLHTTLARKISITGFFLFASIALGASIARMAAFISIEKPRVLMLPIGNDQAMMTECAFYSFLECSISVIAISLPTIAPMCFNADIAGFVKFARSIASLGSRSSSEKISSASEIGRQSPTRIFSGHLSSKVCATHDSRFPGVDSDDVNKIFVQDSISISSEIV